MENKKEDTMIGSQGEIRTEPRALMSRAPESLWPHPFLPLPNLSKESERYVGKKNLF